MCNELTIKLLRFGFSSLFELNYYENPDLEIALQTALNNFIDDAAKVLSYLNANNFGFRILATARAKNNYVL